MIILGTDFSEDAFTAFTVAEALAHTLSTHVAIVYVKPHPDAALPDIADAWLRRARIDRGDVVIKTGTAWLELLRYAEENEAQMICVAAHGNSGYQALSAGSNTRRLLLRSSVPVIVAPAVSKTPTLEMQT